MLDIGVKSLQKSYGGDLVLRDVSFELRSGEKIGLIGANGSGKTTIFKILAERESLDEGTVSKRKGLRLSYLDQIPEYPESYRVMDVLNEAFTALLAIESEMRNYEKQMETATDQQLEKLLHDYNRLQKQFEAQGGYEISERRSRICGGLQLSDAFLQRIFATLSGGEKTSVILAKNLLEAPDVLLLDEPTNHLDMQAVEWLEEFLQKFSGSVIIVSHDRFFLDRTVTRILELEDGSVKSYAGNYSAFHQQKEKDLLGEFENFKNIQKKIKEMKAAAERYRIWGRINTDNSAHMARAKRLEAKIEELQQIQRPQTAKVLQLNTQGNGRSANEVFMVKDVAKSFGNPPLFANVNFTLRYGERVCLLGPNGSGKTTFLNLLLRHEKPDCGEIHLGSRVQVGFLPQEIHFENQQATVLETFRYGFTLSQGEARSYLARFLFTNDDVFKSVACLSGGEKVRLKLARLLYQPPNFLVLDEPTNHLDIASREQIEEMLQTFSGTLFFISHDRYFINKIARQILVIENRTFRHYPGNFMAYRRHEKEQMERQPDHISASSNQSKPDKRSNAKPNKQIRAVNPQKIALLENEIEQLETELRHQQQEAEAWMILHPQDYERHQTWTQKQTEMQTQLDALLEKWTLLQSE